jgi:PAS domain S-box-containing protein
MTNNHTATLEKQIEELRKHNTFLEAQVRQRTFELQVLSDLSHQIGYTLNYDDLFRLMLQHLHRVVPYVVSGSILMLDEPCELVIQYTRPFQPSLLEEIRTRMLTTLARIGGKKPGKNQVNIHTYEVSGGGALQLPVSHIESVFQVPLIVGPQREVVGLLFVGAEQPDAFQEEHVRILYTVANQTSTAIQQLRALLASEEQRLETLVSTLPEGVLLLDEHRHIVLVNPTAQNSLSLLAPNTGVGDVLTHLAQQSLELLLQPFPIRSHELAVDDDNGSSFVFEVSAQPMTAGPQTGGWTLVIRDITGRKRAEEEIRSLNVELEQRVEERTAQLEVANRDLLNEIAAHQQTEETLRQERNLLKSIMDTSPVGIMMANREGRLTFANAYAAHVLKVPVDEILKRCYNDPAWELTDYQDNIIPDEQSVFQQVLTRGETMRDVQQAIRFADGEKILLAINGAPIFDSQGQVEKVVFTVRDVTRRMKTEEALRLNEAKLRMTITQIPSILWVTDSNLMISDVLGSELARLGYNPNSFTGKPIDALPAVSNLDAPEGRGSCDEGSNAPAQVRAGQARAAHARALRGLPSGYETRFDQREFEVRVDPLRDGQRHIVGCIGLAVDITERKRAEEAIRTLNADLEQRVAERTAQLEATNQDLENEIVERRRAEEQTRRMQLFLSSILENIPDVIFVKDAKTMRFVLFNRAAEQVLDFPREAMIGKTAGELFAQNPEYAEVTLSRDRQVVQNRAVLEIPDETTTTPDGQRIFHTRLIPIADEGEGEKRGNVQYVLGISADITERKKAEAELQQAWHAARAATQAKSDFLANMSHEIRTPLNAVIGMTRLLLDTELTAEQRDFIETILVSGESLLAIINDVLDLSKIEAGKMEMVYEPFDIGDCIEKSLSLVSARAAEKYLDLSYTIADTIPRWLMGDRVRVRQILINLLSNAVKFTEVGGIVVSVRLYGDDADDAMDSGNGRGDGVGKGTGQGRSSVAHNDGQAPSFTMHVTVSDTGIGIPQNRMDRLFKSFSQVDTSPSRKYGGTGLGLVISKNLAELMGGTMWAESEDSEGSHFHFTLLTEPATHTLPKTELLRKPTSDMHAMAQHHPLSILLVEDNVFNQKVALRFLEKLGYGADVAENGIEALEALRKHTYDVLLMDVQMPNMDGMETTRHIRDDFPLHEQPWIIAMTAHALHEDRQRCLEAGMDGYISKPVQLEDLVAALEQTRKKSGEIVG